MFYFCFAGWGCNYATASWKLQTCYQRLGWATTATPSCFTTGEIKQSLFNSFLLYLILLLSFFFNLQARASQLAATTPTEEQQQSQQHTATTA